MAERGGDDGGEDVDSLRELVRVDPVGGGPPWHADRVGVGVRVRVKG